ncbi:MAG TPA: BamA/TamA family outer membrane protein [Thermoanaerobaculia bacterium]|nr:BamA/TamA family outer membrane protein [Thermoanaerobaculia bacterium]
MSRSSAPSVLFALLAALLAAVPPAPVADAQLYAPLPQWYGRGFGKNKVQYRDFDWRIYHAPHFDVYYYEAEEPLLQKVVSFAESAYDRLSREFDYQIEEPTPLIFYANHASFEQNNVILNFIPEGVGAFATPARFRMVMPVDLSDPELMGLMLHELTHIFQYHILLGGNLGRAIANQPPTWVMEGMASYMAKDESTTDRMVLRDAVVNDNIPPMTQSNPQGFFAYRIGHAAFDYIEETYGEDGFRDFVYELRNTLGARVGPAVERAFNVDPEDFDADFRRWLRRKYLPELVRTGEPGDFGRPFRVRTGLASQEMSPTASPSGDLVAAFSTQRGELDISLFDTRERELIRNLTRGHTNEFQYLVGQFMTIGFRQGRDIAFSPDGNSIAAFAKRERGRSLVLIDVLGGGIQRVIDMPQVDQQLSPAWHPDGRRIAFQANSNGRFDIFLYDLETGELVNVTDDEVYDAAPTFSPDGRSLVLSSVVGEGFSKLFRIDLDNPRQRFQITFGDSNEKDPVFSPTGRRLYFTSDRDGAVDNIFGLELADGQLHQYTNAVTGCFQPTVLPLPEEGKERLVYTGLWNGRFDLYLTDVDEPVEQVQAELPAGEPLLPRDLPRFQPDIQVTLSEENDEDCCGWKLFLDQADSFIGLDDNQTLIGQVVLGFSDYLGDRRLIGVFSSVDSLSNFDIVYADLSERLQWQVHVFDDRQFFLFRRNQNDPFEPVDRRELYRIQGIVGSLVYPLSFHVRGEIGAGYAFREINQPVVVDPTIDPNTGLPGLEFVELKQDFPLVTGALVGDSASFSSFGPYAGRRWRLDVNYAPDLDEGGTLSASVDLDVRQYIPLTRRSLIALRGFGAVSEGNVANPTYFGGLDTVRGFDFRELAGDRGFFLNAELRFPLIDLLATPVLGFQGIRGILFLDVGGAWYDDFEDFDVWDSEESALADAVASYGYGVSVRFGYFDLNFDFAKRTNFQDSAEGFESSFWIGTRF